MMKQFAIVVITILILAVELSGCNELGGNSKEDRFVGTWNLQSGALVYSLGETVTFFSDGTLSNDSIVATYEINDGKLVVTAGDFARMYAYEYTFSNNDTILTIRHIGKLENKVYSRQ